MTAPVTRTERAGTQLLALLADDAAQSILAATDRRPLSAQRLEEYCDSSLTTIYRRVEELVEHNLLVEQTEVQRNGSHYKTYEANLDRLDVTLEDGELGVEVERRDDAPDNFRGIWDAMQGGRP